MSLPDPNDRGLRTLGKGSSYDPSERAAISVWISSMDSITLRFGLVSREPLTKSEAMTLARPEHYGAAKPWPVVKTDVRAYRRRDARLLGLDARLLGLLEMVNA